MVGKIKNSPSLFEHILTEPISCKFAAWLLRLDALRKHPVHQANQLQSHKVHKIISDARHKHQHMASAVFIQFPFFHVSVRRVKLGVGVPLLHE